MKAVFFVSIICMYIARHNYAAYIAGLHYEPISELSVQTAFIGCVLFLETGLLQSETR